MIIEKSFNFIAVYSDMLNRKNILFSERATNKCDGSVFLLPGNQVDIHHEVQIEQFSWAFLFVPHIKLHGVL